ncbi:TetR/AcrR family transcriptional regulator [Amycolatopsis sp. K13G38]|uniref:TetR/AcrR family transcriptional regulator n=1 Tax=Amycolatopsis acididurans TaxID=2724524 RepID=A0ABX1JES1_9PSEU|nr:TetR/AcrR family transcriptional regulator C-terminal domain-containing protein [Amycolatopsis acididurans]NKQ56737.1 TetR/AcrR family transcriptional regulator [Amycolatopsis acididurans]
MPHEREPQADLRDRMGSSADVRAQRTRERLVTAFEELAAEGATDIKVKDVVTRAGVNRTSFYAHFSGVDALAMAAMTDYFEAVGLTDAAHRLDDPYKTSLESLQDVIEFIADRATFYERLLSSESTPFFSAVEDAFTERNRVTLRGIKTLPDSVDIDTAARYVAAGVMGVIAQWLRGGRTESAAVLAARLRDLLPPYLTGGGGEDRSGHN